MADTLVALVGLLVLVACAPALHGAATIGWVIGAGLLGFGARWADRRRRTVLGHAILAVAVVAVAAALVTDLPPLQWSLLSALSVAEIVAPLALAIVVLATRRLAFVVGFAGALALSVHPMTGILSFGLARHAISAGRAGDEAARHRLSAGAAGIFALIAAAALAHDLGAQVGLLSLSSDPAATCEPVRWYYGGYGTSCDAMFRRVYVDGPMMFLPRLVLETSCVVSAVGLALGRGWGLVGLAVSGVGLGALLAVGTALGVHLPIFGGGCTSFPHVLEWGPVSLLAAVSLGLAVGPWAGPALRFLRDPAPDTTPVVRPPFIGR